ncbi:phosphatase PAP2 family protein [Streptomyces rochei]|uniref:phosphatase PAP2 family protein n=1 Tax=Streptomyces rochei TaxID=1928 RepID=UPI0033B75661
MAGAVYALPAVAVVVAVQRVHSGSHYPREVAAGAAIGGIGAWVVHWLSRLPGKVIL